MARLVATDLETITSFTNNILSHEEADIESLKSSINEFITTSQTQLTGEAWDKARANLNGYFEVLELRKQCTQAISEAIQSANGIMTNYINDPLLPDGIADDSKLEEITTQLNNANRDLASVKYQISSYNKLSDTEKKESNINISSLQSQADTCQNTINKLQPLYDKLTQLSPTDANAAGNYESAISAISQFQSAVASLETSNITI